MNTLSAILLVIVAVIVGLIAQIKWHGIAGWVAVGLVIAVFLVPPYLWRRHRR